MAANTIVMSIGLIHLVLGGILLYAAMTNSYSVDLLKRICDVDEKTDVQMLHTWTYIIGIVLLVLGALLLFFSFGGYCT